MSTWSSTYARMRGNQHRVRSCCCVLANPGWSALSWQCMHMSRRRSWSVKCDPSSMSAGSVTGTAVVTRTSAPAGRTVTRWRVPSVRSSPTSGCWYTVAPAGANKRSAPPAGAGTEKKRLLRQVSMRSLWSVGTETRSGWPVITL